LQGIATEAGTLIGGAIGGPGGAAIGGGLGGLIEGGGGSSGSTRGTQRRTPRSRGGQSIAPTSQPPTTQGGGGVAGGGQFTFPNINIPGIGSIGGGSVGAGLTIGGGSSSGGSSSDGGMQVMGQNGFTNALVLEMLEDSVTSKQGRSVLQAITSGALQRGVIQPVTTVQTPRGERNYSPPGFRTIYLNDEPYAVFKPLARALGYRFNGSQSELKKLDKQARKYLSNRKKVKKLAGKVGLKTSNRATGPKR